MSSSIVSALMILFIIPSIFLLCSTAVIAESSASSMIKDICYGGDKELCIQILESEPKTASAPNLSELSIAIMELGISNATTTYNYIENMLEKIGDSNPSLQAALHECKGSYDWSIISMKGAIHGVRDEKEYQTTTYDLSMAGMDSIDRCRMFLDQQKFQDETILSGNRFVKIFALSASNAVDALALQNYKGEY